MAHLWTVLQTGYIFAPHSRSNRCFRHNKQAWVNHAPGFLCRSNPPSLFAGTFIPRPHSCWPALCRNSPHHNCIFSVCLPHPSGSSFPALTGSPRYASLRLYSPLHSLPLSGSRPHGSLFPAPSTGCSLSPSAPVPLSRTPPFSLSQPGQFLFSHLTSFST